LKVKVTA